MKRYNIAIIGKSGVGKSSLINYLFDEKELAKTGTGAPVTEPGFHLYRKDINTRNYSVYDSFGLEPGKVVEWRKSFEQFIDPKQTSLKVDDWLHTTIYCISGASSRYEDFELDIIKTLEKHKLNPIIVLTKSDSKSSRELAESLYIKTRISPILVCSIEKKNFGGIVRAEGRDELIEKIQINAKHSFQERIPIMLKEFERDLIKKEYLRLFESFKSDLGKSKDFLGSIPKAKLDKITNIYKGKFEETNTYIKTKIQIKLNNAISFYNTNILVRNEEEYKINIFKFEENNGWNDLSLVYKTIVFTIGLPLVFLATVRELIYGGTCSVEDVLKGFKKNLLHSFYDDKELMMYFNNKIKIE